jgi:hypothetical protein
MYRADWSRQVFSNWMTGNVEDLEFSYQALREDGALLAGGGACAVSSFGFFCVSGDFKEEVLGALEVFSAGLCEADRTGGCGLFRSVCEEEGFNHPFVDFCSFKRVDSPARYVLTKDRDPSIYVAEESWSV